MEAQFNSQNIDIAFTSRIPSKQKLKYVYQIGEQEFLNYNSNKNYEVYSLFEFNQKKRASKNVKTIVSNSLMVRRKWLETQGGKGQIPGEIKSLRRKTQTPVLVIGNELVNDKIWEHVKLTFGD